MTVQPAIAERGGALVVLGPARPEHIAGFRAATGYVSPSWQTLVQNLAQDPTPYAKWINA